MKWAQRLLEQPHTMANKSKAYYPVILVLTLLPCSASSINASSLTFQLSSGVESMTLASMMVSVIPEASAVLLGGLGLLALLRRRH